MRQACLGRVPRRSSTRFAENLRPETRRFFRLESRRTQPYGRMARDETNQTGKYCVSGTMPPESLCPGLQRRTPCPCSLSDSLRACQKYSFLTSSKDCAESSAQSFSYCLPSQPKFAAADAPAAAAAAAADHPPRTAIAAPTSVTGNQTPCSELSPSHSLSKKLDKMQTASCTFLRYGLQSVYSLPPERGGQSKAHGGFVT